MLCLAGRSSYARWCACSLAHPAYAPQAGLHTAPARHTKWHPHAQPQTCTHNFVHANSMIPAHTPMDGQSHTYKCCAQAVLAAPFICSTHKHIPHPTQSGLHSQALFFAACLPRLYPTHKHTCAGLHSQALVLGSMLPTALFHTQNTHTHTHLTNAGLHSHTLVLRQHAIYGVPQDLRWVFVPELVRHSGPQPAGVACRRWGRMQVLTCMTAHAQQMEEQESRLKTRETSLCLTCNMWAHIVHMFRCACVVCMCVCVCVCVCVCARVHVCTTAEDVAVSVYVTVCVVSVCMWLCVSVCVCVYVCDCVCCVCVYVTVCICVCMCVCM
jgi:hypothetical protein